MSLNSTPLNTTPINSDLAPDSIPESAQIEFTQSVSYPTGDASIVFTQQVGATSQASIDFTQTVFDETFTAASWKDWDLVVKVAGVDVGESLVDAGDISVDCERISARLAEFTLRISGTVDAQTWTGKPVTIEWIQGGGAIWRLFTGVIIEPKYNEGNATIRCRCSDDLQRIIDGQTNAQIKDMTGGRWSKYVFSEENTGWNYLQDLLSTQSVSVEMDAFGALHANSLQNKESQDYTFTSSQILDNPAEVSFAQRASLINRVDINFKARFERLYQRNERAIWIWASTFCENQSSAIVYPSKSMVRDAVDSAGWTILAESFTSLWNTGTYICGGAPVLWTNAYPEGVRGFDIRAAFRWQQSVTDEFTIKVTAPASIAVYGELKGSYSTAADFDYTGAAWTGNEADFTAPLSGFLVDDLHNLYKDQLDSVELENALLTAISVAVERINASHRAARVTFKLPLTPYLDLRHTLRINDTNIQAKGIVWRLQHVLNLSTAEAVTQVEIAISCGQSGADFTTPVYSAPAHANQPAPVGYQDIIDVPTHVGGLVGSPAFDDAWWGVVTNTDGALSTAPYPQELRLQFAAIPDAKTQNKTDTTVHEIQITVPHNLLNATA